MSDACVKEELGVRIEVIKDDVTTCKKVKSFNPAMAINREFSLCTLSVLAEERDQPECLDAFGCTGLVGLQWKKNLKHSVKVTVAEVNPVALETIRKHVHLNDCRLKSRVRFASSSDTLTDVLRPSLRSTTTDKTFSASFVRCSVENQNPQESQASSDDVPLTVEVIQSDVNVLLHQRRLDFIHLDPNGCIVPYLDALFKNIYDNGIVMLTSTDVASLLGKCPQVAQRNYGALCIKTDYSKEFAVRLVTAAAVRAAARSNKGIKVLYAVAVDHFILVAIQVLRGPHHADRSVSSIRRVLHCRCCQERIIYPMTSEPIADPYALLPCDCHHHTQAKVGLELGPIWAGKLFDIDFLKKMQLTAKTLKLSNRLESLLITLTTEAVCASNSSLNATIQRDREPVPGMDGPVTKRMKVDDLRRGTEYDMPPFYYFVHRLRLKNVEIPKASKLIQLLQDEGHRCSRTHFDPTAIRTSANGQQLRDILKKHCRKS